MLQTPHQSPKSRSASGTGGILVKPLSKSCVQCRMFRARHLPGLLNQRLVGAEGDVFHTKTVYTIPVYYAKFYRISRGELY
jgi:hypothetical protein